MNHSSSEPEFQTQQILCLEFAETRLFAALIQDIPARRLCWLRPIALLIDPEFAPLPADQQALDRATARPVSGHAAPTDCQTKDCQIKDSQTNWLGSDRDEHRLIWRDLRQAADLLYPAVLLRAAFDTEVIPLLSQLEQLPTPASSLSVEPEAQQALRQLVQRVCWAHPQAFCDREWA